MKERISVISGTFNLSWLKRQIILWFKRLITMWLGWPTNTEENSDRIWATVIDTLLKNIDFEQVKHNEIGYVKNIWQHGTTDENIVRANSNFPVRTFIRMLALSQPDQTIEHFVADLSYLEVTFLVDNLKLLEKICGANHEDTLKMLLAKLTLTKVFCGFSDEKFEKLLEEIKRIWGEQHEITSHSRLHYRLISINNWSIFLANANTLGTIYIILLKVEPCKCGCKSCKTFLHDE